MLMLIKRLFASYYFASIMLTLLLNNAQLNGVTLLQQTVLVVLHQLITNESICFTSDSNQL